MTLLDVPYHKEYLGISGSKTNLANLFAEGREPMFIADIIQRRLDVRNDSELSPVRKVWWDIQTYAGDIWLKNPKNGRAKILCYSPDALRFMREVIPPDEVESSFRRAFSISDKFFKKAE